LPKSGGRRAALPDLSLILDLKLNLITLTGQEGRLAPADGDTERLFFQN